MMLRFAILLVLTAALARAADPALPAEITRIAFGSCLKQDRPAPIFDGILASRPDVFVWLGDNIYGDSDDPAVIAGKYKLLGEIEGFKKLRATVPMLATWDDHDLGKNDAGVEYPFKEQNKKLMLDFFGEPEGSERRRREGNYDAKTIGPPGRRVQVILLDTRSFRSPMKSETRGKLKYYVPSDDPKATVLGEAQWAWLGEQLKQPADLRLICSSIQLSNDGHRFEKWANFPAERARMLALLDGVADRPYFVLSGDRHHGSIYAWGRHGHEITASALNQGGMPSPEDLAARDLVGKPTGAHNFGYIEIDWKTFPAAATVQLRSEKNQVLVEGSFNSSGLPAKAQ
ncbi:MAG TPA: alkaline phosphatase D family protein [Tepidisphaeraceae bacterium]